MSQWTKLKRPVCIFSLFPHRFGKTFSGVSLNCQCFSAQLQEHQLPFFSLFHSLSCQRNEANAAAPQGSSCLLPYNNFWIHWPNPSQFESQWGSQSYSALSYIVRQLRGLLLLHQRKATELIPSRSHSERETLETALILLLRSSPDTNTALLSSCCSAGTCHCTQSLFPLFSSHHCSILHLERLQPPLCEDRFSPEMENLPSSLEEAGTVCYVTPDVNSILSLAATWASCSLSSGLTANQLSMCTALTPPQQSSVWARIAPCPTGPGCPEQQGKHSLGRSWDDPHTIGCESTSN